MTMLAEILIVTAAVCALAALAVTTRGLLNPRRLYVDPIRDVLILAAHQDDCVILAGEYAIEAAKAGLSIQVAYLTCGAQAEQDDRARTRRAEAEKAWGLLGVPPANLHHFGLPQAPVSGPSRIVAEQFESARGRLLQLVLGLPRDSAVFIPAAGESHIDHRTLRRLALEVIGCAGRDDLVVLEAPEYNEHYSLLCCPRRALAYVARGIPLLGRFVHPNDECVRATFIGGPRTFALRADLARLERKRELLREFRSEDGELLVRYFGYADQFRLIDRPDLALAKGDSDWSYFRFDGKRLGPSLLLLWLSLWLGAMLLACKIVSLVAIWRPSTAVVLALCSCMGLLLFSFRSSGHARRAFLASSAVGLFWGAVRIL